MSYIGNQPLYQSFVTDTFSGNGSTTAFTMSVAPANTASVLVAVSGVVQDPSTYSVVGTTLTFSAAPPTGTGNISARYLGIPASNITTTAYRTVTEFTATASQTTFTPPSYTPGFINVYRNGSLLGAADYTATNGTTVVLAVGATVGDLVVVESFYVSSVLNAIPATSGAVGTSYIASGAVTPTQLSTQSQYTGFKNRIINGGMTIDQRNAGASGTAGGFTVDRWQYSAAQSSKGTWQQNAGSVTPPAGFINYLGFTSSSAYSVLTGDFFGFLHRIEGLNVADLGWGTANAQTVTLSFWVRSSLTGTFGGALVNSATNRSYPFTYTIAAANTWEKETITIAGDTSGTWLTTNGIGISLYLGMGVGTTYSGTAGAWAGAYYLSATGATSVVGTNGATFYITGVQLEAGSVATSFDFRPYGTELALCQRYYEKMSSANGTMNSGAGTFIALGMAENASRTQPLIQCLVQKRAQPSVTISTVTTDFGLRGNNASSVICTSGSFGGLNQRYISGDFNAGSSVTATGGSAWLTNHSGNAVIEISAEL